jgi:hypothetical protein
LPPTAIHHKTFLCKLTIFIYLSVTCISAIHTERTVVILLQQRFTRTRHKVIGTLPVLLILTFIPFSLLQLAI